MSDCLELVDTLVGFFAEASSNIHLIFYCDVMGHDFVICRLRETTKAGYAEKECTLQLKMLRRGPDRPTSQASSPSPYR